MVLRYGAKESEPIKGRIETPRRPLGLSARLQARGGVRSSASTWTEGRPSPDGPGVPQGCVLGPLVPDYG